jgi:hypothetical protein
MILKKVPMRMNIPVESALRARFHEKSPDVRFLNSIFLALISESGRLEDNLVETNI